MDFDPEDRLPTEEERKTLRLVADRIPIAAVLIAVVEFGEPTSLFLDVCALTKPQNPS